MQQRVVISGYGVISPFGKGESVLKEHIFKAQPGFYNVTSFDALLDFTKRLDQVQLHERNYQHFVHYCTNKALSASKLNFNTDKNFLSEAIVAVGNVGDSKDFHSFYKQYHDKEFTNCTIKQVSFDDNKSTSIFDRDPFTHADAVAKQIGSSQPAIAFTNACVASLNAIGYGYDQVRFGRAPCAVVGGVNVLHPYAFGHFDSTRALANDVVRPFSKGRTGLLLSDGAAMLVLETLESCVQRGAKPLAEIIGWGACADGYEIIKPCAEGKGMARTMQMALRKANCKAEDIDYINAHGTGTPLNDISETRAIKRVFGKAAKSTPISSTKSMTGHMLEAAGAVEAVTSIIALNENKIPPTVNYLEPDKELDLDYVTEGTRDSNLNIVMTNSAAFGGNNCSMILKKCVA